MTNKISLFISHAAVDAPVVKVFVNLIGWNWRFA
jgi:hypothetical protein